jgi:NTE family protein
MINILTEQNVQRSLATMGERDVLVSPQLGVLTSGDFVRGDEFIALGERGAQVALGKLQPLARSADEYAQWRAALPTATAKATTEAPLAAASFDGSTVTNPARFAAQLESQPGQPFERGRAERDVRSLMASGDYLRVDYRIVTRDGRDELLFDLDDKPWGPNYLRVGLDLSTDFEGRGSFNLKFSHNRHWLTPSGTEWRNRVQIGAVPSLFTEIYHPLNWTIGISNDWFVAGYAGAERRNGTLYNERGDELARYKRQDARIGLDLGQPWGRFGEVRLGLTSQRISAEPTLVSAAVTGIPQKFRSTDVGARLAVVVDQLDYANFPTQGYRLVGQLAIGEGSAAGRFQQLETSAMSVQTFGTHSFSLFGAVRGASQREPSAIGRYELGGFHQLSGYRDGQLLGNYVAFSRLTWYWRLPYSPLAARGLFLGATAEAGNAWATKSAVREGGVRTGMSVFVGADTGLGPLYLGLTHAPRGETGVALFLGRP